MLNEISGASNGGLRVSNAQRIVRAGILAAGLGIGAAVASAGTASADPFAFDPTNIALSIDGLNLIENGTAHAMSAFGDIAFADGAYSVANATGFVDSASAEGVHSTAETFGTVDLGGATGTNSFVYDGPGFLGAAFANGDWLPCRRRRPQRGGREH